VVWGEARRLAAWTDTRTQTYAGVQRLPLSQTSEDMEQELAAEGCDAGER
jgi:hypothetical protein